MKNTLEPSTEPPPKKAKTTEELIEETLLLDFDYDALVNLPFKN